MAGRMVRKQVYIELDQERRLKQRARQLGVTEAALIRQSLDRVLVSPATKRPDAAAWTALMQFFRRRSRMRVPQKGRTWTRDELYDRPRPHR
jgi:hypothetical protein